MVVQLVLLTILSAVDVMAGTHGGGNTGSTGGGGDTGSHTPHHPPAHPECVGLDCNVVDMAIIDVEQYYSNTLCQSLVKLDCADHIITNDEVLCGTDGNTYNNHCLFTVARCRNLIHNGQVLHVAYTGHCTKTTAAPITIQATAAMTGVPTTDLSATSTTMATATAASTPDPANGAIMSTFCQHAASIDCNHGFNILCGSDGHFYPNDCELSKAKCLDPGLVSVDPTNCHV